MLDYFENKFGKQDYFEGSKTQPGSTYKAAQKSTTQGTTDAQRVFEKPIASYGLKKTSLVVRRYGIK